MIKDKAKGRESISMYERLSSKLPLPYQLSWSMVAGVLLLTFGLIIKLTSGSTSNILMPTFACIIIAFVPIAITWASLKLSVFEGVLKDFVIMPESELSLWYQSQLKAINSPTHMIIGGLIFAAAFVPSAGTASKWWHYPDPWFYSKQCDIFLTLLVTLAAFMLGTAVSVMIMSHNVV